MSKNLFSLVFVGVFFVGIVLMWKFMGILNTLVDETIEFEPRAVKEKDKGILRAIEWLNEGG